VQGRGEARFAAWGGGFPAGIVRRVAGRQESG